MTRYALALMGSLIVLTTGCVTDIADEAPATDSAARVNQATCSATPFEEPVPPFVIPIESNDEPHAPDDTFARSAAASLVNPFIMNAAGCNSCCGAAGYTLATFNGTCYCANLAPNRPKPAEVCSGDPVGICTFNAGLPSNPPPAKGTPGQHNQVKVTASTW